MLDGGEFAGFADVEHAGLEIAVGDALADARQLGHDAAGLAATVDQASDAIAQLAELAGHVQRRQALLSARGRNPRAQRRQIVHGPAGGEDEEKRGRAGRNDDHAEQHRRERQADHREQR